MPNRSSVEIWIAISGSWCYKGFVNLFDIPSARTCVATARHTTQQQWWTFCGLPVVYPEILTKNTKSWCLSRCFWRFSCHKHRGEIIWEWASLCPQRIFPVTPPGVGGTETFEARARRDDEFRGEDGQTTGGGGVWWRVVFHTHLRSAFQNRNTLHFPKLKCATSRNWDDESFHVSGWSQCKGLASNFC